MDYPTPAVMVEPCFHRARAVVDIHRGSKYQHVCFVHRFGDRLKLLLVRTLFFAFHKAIGTATAELAEISRQEELCHLAAKFIG